MSLQLVENKALSRGIIGKAAPLLAEITIRKSQDDLTEAFERIALGSFDDEKGTYSCQVGGQQKTVEGKRVSALSNHVLAWKLGPFK